MFLGLGARREQKKERNRSLGSLRCSCARWKGSWGSAASSPRRHRGGGRRAHWGRVARAGEIQREGAVGPGVKGVTRGAVVKLELACGWPRAVGDAAVRRR